MILKAYRITEYDWYAAESAEQAINLAMADTGESKEDTVDDMYFTGEPESDDIEIWDDESMTKKIKLSDFIATQISGAGWCFGIDA
jgi:SRSO17 transposase